MNSNLRIKAIVIIAVLLVCIYGVIGIPKSKAELVENWKKNIRLGLDLRGGSQLVMQIQVQDAFKADADATIDRMKDELRKAGVDYGAIDRNDPQGIGDAFEREGDDPRYFQTFSIDGYAFGINVLLYAMTH